MCCHLLSFQLLHSVSYLPIYHTQKSTVRAWKSTSRFNWGLLVLVRSLSRFTEPSVSCARVNISVCVYDGFKGSLKCDQGWHHCSLWAWLCNHWLPCNMLITTHLTRKWTRWQKREKRISHSNQFLFVSLNWRQSETSLYKLWGCSWHAKHAAMLPNYPLTSLLWPRYNL